VRADRVIGLSRTVEFLVLEGRPAAHGFGGKEIVTGICDGGVVLDFDEFGEFSRCGIL
jgi:hypothetical protein